MHTNVYKNTKLQKDSGPPATGSFQLCDRWCYFPALLLINLEAQKNPGLIFISVHLKQVGYKYCFKEVCICMQLSRTFPPRPKVQYSWSEANKSFHNNPGPQNPSSLATIESFRPLSFSSISRPNLAEKNVSGCIEARISGWVCKQ